MAKLSQEKINSLRTELVALNKAYREGTPQISDVDYDHMVETLRENSPEDEFFKKGIIEEATDRMEPLPVPMYSLEKIKEIKDLRKWLVKMKAAGANEITAMPKFDGISLVVDENQLYAWTRGDGVEGQRSDSHYGLMANGEMNNNPEVNYTWGEAIISKVRFEEMKTDEGFTYKNARNMVAGIFNAETGYESPYIQDIVFVRYGCDMEIDKGDQIAYMSNQFKNVTTCVSFYIDEILDLSDEELEELVDVELYDTFKDGKYRIDGVVIEVDEYAVRKKLGRLPNGNPAYGIAFKKDAWCDLHQTTVTGIEFGIGKTGVLNPVILMEPVEMNGATVSRATAYNAASLIDNHICKGAIIEVTRGGEVIPKHVNTISYDENEFTAMMDDIIICPSCGEPLKWDETHVNLVCSNESCKERVISELVYFFRTMGCEQFEEPTIRRLYAFGYRTVDSILEAHRAEFQKLLGESKGKTVSEQIQKVLAGVPLARYLTALNIFDGKIAEVTCQKILDSMTSEGAERIREKKYSISTIQDAVDMSRELQGIPGVGEVLAKTFVKGLVKFAKTPKDVRVVITYTQTPTISLAEGVEKLYVCMTGFRDKNLEAEIKAKGHEVVNGITRNCNVLIAKDVNSKSGKIKEALEKGVKIVSIEQFMNEILL